MGGQNLSNLLALITLAWRYPVPKLADEHDNWKQGADTPADIPKFGLDTCNVCCCSLCGV